MTDFTDQLLQEQLQKREAMFLQLSQAYDQKLEDDMGKLHNQFVGFISASKLPLPQVLLVLQILIRETIDQAFMKYMGD